MITLVVEVTIIGYINRNINMMYSDPAIVIQNFSMTTVSNLFTFVFFFFTAAPAAIYLYARLKLLDSSTKFWRIYSTLGYSYVSYVPAIAFTLFSININFVKWLFIMIALGNQLFGLYKQADHLQNSLTGAKSGGNNQQEMNEADKT